MIDLISRLRAGLCQRAVVAAARRQYSRPTRSAARRPEAGPPRDATVRARTPGH
jgi:hypothetical protein